MASNIGKMDIHDVLERHQVRYEVHPYYVASPKGQRVQAGFDVDLYGTLETWHLPLYGGEEGHGIVQYFESIAQEIQFAYSRCPTSFSATRDVEDPD